MTAITNALAADDLLIQAAEEAAKLAQALTKYYRVLHGVNPSPVSLTEAREHVIEEIADVNVANGALMRKLGITGDEVADVEAEKIERWERKMEFKQAMRIWKRMDMGTLITDAEEAAERDTQTWTK